MKRILLALLMFAATLTAPTATAHAATSRHVCNVHAVANGYYNCTWTTNVAATLSDYRAAILAGGSRVLFVIYEDINYGGEVTMLYVGNGCQDDPGDMRSIPLEFLYGGAGPFGWWSDRISSYVNGNDYPNGAQCDSAWSKTYDVWGDGQFFYLPPYSLDHASMPSGYNDQVKVIDIFG